MNQPHLDPQRRHDAVLLFDVIDGNPNGDPDAGNQPRTDVETGHGLVTDVCLKRKIRDQIPLLRPDEPRYKIFVEADIALNTNIKRAFTATGTPLTKKTTPQQRSDVQQWLCNEFFDIRMFGGVVGTGDGNAGRIRGPLQLTFARSLSPILTQAHGITRITQTTEKDIESGESTEMGSKWTVHYGLYRTHLHYSHPVADTGEPLRTRPGQRPRRNGRQGPLHLQPQRPIRPSPSQPTIPTHPRRPTRRNHRTPIHQRLQN
jgi:CRISPR-associated protein Csd2